jgi:hypothetical protein
MFFNSSLALRQGPAFVRVAEREVASLPIGLEAKRVDPAALPLAHKHLAFLADGHG